MKKFIILSLLLISALNASDCDYFDDFSDHEYDPSTDRSKVLRLHEACIDGDMQLVEKYIKSGDNINTTMLSFYYKDYFGFTPLQIACKKNNFSLAKYLLENKAYINAEGFNNITALNVTILSNNIKLFDYLIQKGAQLGDKNSTHIHFAAQNNCLTIIKHLIEKKVDINSKDQDRENTPLHLAVKNGHIETINYLISQNAIIDIANNYGCTPLFEAVYDNKIDIIIILLSKYSELKKDIDGHTLHTACKCDKVKIVELLVNNGANIHKQNRESLTLIETACKYDKLETFKYLLTKELELDSNFLKLKQQSLMDLAKKSTKLLIFKFIHSNYGIDNVDIKQLAYNACISGDLYALHILVSKKQIDIISFVRENYSSVLYEIFKAEKIDILKYLIKLDPSLISEKFKGNYILSYDYNINMYIELLNYLDFFPNILKEEYLGKNIEHPDIAISLLQRSFNLKNELVNAKIRELFPNTEINTVQMFKKAKSLLLEILQSNDIKRIKSLKNLNIFFSPIQMAEIIINKLHNPTMNEKVIIELITCTATYFDLLELKNLENKSIIHHIVDLGEKGENLCLLISKLCEDKILKKCYINEDKFYIDFRKNVDTIKRKKEAECTIL